eukprot:3294308-Lingulodinium_polyedra.AAC.1
MVTGWKLASELLQARRCCFLCPVTVEDGVDLLHVQNPLPDQELAVDLSLKPPRQAAVIEPPTDDDEAKYFLSGFEAVDHQG